MGIPPRELKSRLTASELVEFMAFSLLEPFGGQREDDRARGMMAMSLAAAGAKNVDPAKFLPVYEPPTETDDAAGWASFLSRLDVMAGRNQEG